MDFMDYVVCSFKWIHITILKVIYNARLVVAEAQTRIVYDGIVCMIATTRRVQCRTKVARLVCPTILYFLLGLVTLQLLLLTLLIPSSFSTLPPFSLSLHCPLFLTDCLSLTSSYSSFYYHIQALLFHVY